MSFQNGDTFVIKHKPKGTCELYGKFAELRPYRPKGENICVECGEKNMEATLKQIHKRMGTASKVAIEPEALQTLTRKP